jgi:hypothetical protein
MITITDTNATTAFDNLTYSPPPPNIDLTATLINSIPTTGIINNTITTAVKTMLLSIIGNTNVNLSAKTELAMYVGFTTNTAVIPNTVNFNSANVSLDKLTFYIIFRLPYTNISLTYEDIDNGLTSSSLPSNPTTWGKYANYIRSLIDSGIKKINSAGEQVNANGKPIDDNEVEIDGWHNENAYSYLGLDPFSTNVTVPPGCYSRTTERAMLFGQNTDQPNGTNPSLPITKIPVYFFLLAKVENPYNTVYWLKNDKDSQTISRIPHWPSSIREKKYRKHFVKTTSTLTIANGTYNLVKEGNNIYFNLEQPNPTPVAKIYITAINADTLLSEGLQLTDADKVEKTVEGLIAIWETKYDYPVMVNNSGLTFGMGVDIGATFNGFYSIKFNVTFVGSGTFRLYSGGKRTPAISNTGLTCNSLEASIATLLGIAVGRVTIKDANNGNNGVPNKITILRQNDGNDMAYNHMIYAYDLTNSLTVTLTPIGEDDRWEDNSSAVKDGWFYLNKLLNYSFNNAPATDDAWLDELSLNAAEKTTLVKLLKKCMGCRSKSSYHIWNENKAIFKKLEIKSYVQNLRATYHKFFIPRFYNLKRELSDGTFSEQGKDSVQYLLNHASLKAKPNQAELFAIVLLSYNFPSKYRSNHSELIKAINEHSISKLKVTMAGLSKDRKNALNSFLTADVIDKIYHGISN